MTKECVGSCLKYNIRLLIISLHASLLVQPLDLATFGPLKTLLSGKPSRVAKLAMRQFRRLEWLLAFTVVRPVALRASKIAGGFRQSGLIPYAPSAVLQRLPPNLPLCSEPSNQRRKASFHRISPLLFHNVSPTSPYRRVANAAVRRMLLSKKPLKSSAKKYLKKVVDYVELLQKQLTIAQKELQQLKELVEGKTRQRAGKRLVIKVKILVTTSELVDQVRTAEATTALKKSKKPLKKIRLKLNLKKKRCWV